MTSISFQVRGIPVPQGSAKPFIAGGRARLATKSAPLMAWRTAIADAAGRTMGERPLLEGPLVVEATFGLSRPASLPRRIDLPATRPDLDKLVRALLDGMTGVVFRDDGQVTRLVVAKRYGPHPGVTVTTRGDAP
jgi:Holliday junction resolvase RusA-like endonuclease